MCNVTHKLLVIGRDVMRRFHKNVQYHSLAVDHRKGCDETAFHKNVQSHAQPVDHSLCDETAFHKLCNGTHKLLVIGKDVMRQPFMKMCNGTHNLLVIGNNVTTFTKLSNHATHSLVS